VSMSSLLTGTVTFPFTDMEGSTRLWQQHPALMKDALVRHHGLLKQAIEPTGGYVFQMVGDAFCAAFHTAPEGVVAAIAAQRAHQAKRLAAGRHNVDLRAGAC
jgi:class 3 adenylate cyclase